MLASRVRHGCAELNPEYLGPPGAARPRASDASATMSEGTGPGGCGAERSRAAVRASDPLRNMLQLWRLRSALRDDAGLLRRHLHARLPAWTPTACGLACVDLWNDVTHCGLCEASCEPGQFCVEGACANECPAGTMPCGTRCADTTTSHEHCGGCGQPCGATEICDAGACASGCAVGLEVCGDSCVDTQQDEANCGGCGQRVRRGPVLRGRAVPRLVSGRVPRVPRRLRRHPERAPELRGLQSALLRHGDLRRGRVRVPIRHAAVRQHLHRPRHRRAPLRRLHHELRAEPDLRRRRVHGGLRGQQGRLQQRLRRHLEQLAALRRVQPTRAPRCRAATPASASVTATRRCAPASASTRPRARSTAVGATCRATGAATMAPARERCRSRAFAVLAASALVAWQSPVAARAKRPALARRRDASTSCRSSWKGRCRRR